MRLNPDCIRDILFSVEENTGFGYVMKYPNSELHRLSCYSKDEVYYHIKQCELSGLITEANYFLGGGCMVHDLSPYGHEFIANIRTEDNWSKTKDIANKVGSYSLDALSKIAVGVITSLINKHL